MIDRLGESSERLRRFFHTIGAATSDPERHEAYVGPPPATHVEQSTMAIAAGPIRKVSVVQVTEEDWESGDKQRHAYLSFEIPDPRITIDTPPVIAGSTLIRSATSFWRVRGSRWRGGAAASDLVRHLNADLMTAHVLAETRVGIDIRADPVGGGWIVRTSKNRLALSEALWEALQAIGEHLLAATVSLPQGRTLRRKHFVSGFVVGTVALITPATAYAIPAFLTHEPNMPVIFLAVYAAFCVVAGFLLGMQWLSISAERDDGTTWTARSVLGYSIAFVAEGGVSFFVFGARMVF